MKNIENKITGYKFIKQDDQEVKVEPVIEDTSVPIALVHRPTKLIGTTYKLQVPEHISKHSLFITINDLEEDGVRRPFEIFVNTKTVDNQHWITALTLVMSAVFRKGGDVDFLVQELKSVFDPSGGYWNGGKFQKSIIVELGNILEEHLSNQKPLVKEVVQETPEVVPRTFAYLGNATVCPKCDDKAVIVKEGCSQCVSCGYSKCG